MKEALYAEVIDEKKQKIQCFLCPHQCQILPEKKGICGIRKNIKGKLYSLTYNQFTSVALDPIEKKPLYHFFPGREILSLGTVGCNLRCLYCQNWEISQAKIEETALQEVSAERVIRMSKEYHAVGIAYTYNEPLINFEWLLETARKAKKESLKNVLVTNGYLNEAPLENLLPYIDAANVDVKSFRDDFYKRVCGGRLSPVLRSVEIMLRRGIHVEITNLLIPRQNDSPEEIEDLTDWVYSLGEEVPLHFSRFIPCYKMKEIPATPLPILERARKIAFRKLKYVYLGNVWEVEYNRTYCPDCGEILLERYGYRLKLGSLKAGACSKCGRKIRIITK
jgi:pyruvate formate lyase activating enzyme